MSFTPSAEETLAAPSAPTEHSAGGPGTKAHAVERGASIGRYVVLGPIGTGAMGTVVAAYDPELDRKVAIKLLHARSDEAAATLRREAQTLARLTHPNVVTVHDVGMFGAGSERAVFLAMEYVEGTTLRRWCRARPRSVAEIVAAFVLAGRGLAAAHRAGIVHCDFKPDNVLVADDPSGAGGHGRICVADFGVAEHGEAATTGAKGDARRSGPIGTPAYMAPEQFLGGAIDPRCDQYSFCVALFEAIAGVRPFAEEGLASLAEHRDVRRDVPRPVPAKILRLLQRGLDRVPERRFADMDALLHALVATTRRRRSAWLLGAGAVVIAATTWGIARSTGEHAQELCDAATDRLAGIWDAEVRARMATAFRGSPVPFAAATVERIVPELETWASAWIGEQRDACVATHVRGEQSLRELDLRSSCLDRQLEHGHATIALLVTGERDVVLHAGEMVAALPRAEQCHDPAVLDRAPPPPTDPQAAAIVAGLELSFAEIQALHDAARDRQSFDLARDAFERAQASGHEPTIARAKYHLGNQQHMLMQYADADAMLREAFDSAIAVGDDGLATNIATSLVAVTRELGRFDEGRSWGVVAHALARRVGDPQDLGALAANLTLVELSAGRLDRAMAHAEEALEIRRALPPDDPRIGEALVNVSAAYDEAGRSERARWAAGAALEHWERVLGAEHPNTLTAQSNLAIMEQAAGEFDSCFARLEGVVEARRRMTAPDHPSVLDAMTNLAGVKFASGRLDEARALIERASALDRQSEHRDPTLEPRLHLTAALIERAAGNLDAAAEHAAIGVELSSAPQVSQILRAAQWSVRGEIAVERGRFAEAQTYLRTAVHEFEPLGVRHAYTLHARALLALAWRGEGRHAEALAEVHDVLAALPDTEAKPTARAEVEWVAARVLVDSDRAGALQLARKARDTLARVHRDQEVQELDRWLAAATGR